MKYRKILTIQDISCVGQCSMTVGMPLMSACGLETCILPSAVLSTHTGGFSFPAIRDLTDDLPGFVAHWKKEGISFEGICTGYLGSTRQIAMVREILENMVVENGKTVVDPAMADHGKLYAGFDDAYVQAMKGLCAAADIMIPNLTEACLLADMPWKEDMPREEILAVVEKLHALGMKCVVLTGIGDKPGDTGALISVEGKIQTYSRPHVGKNFHGTGDIFTAVFFGALMQEKSLLESAALAAEFTARAVEATLDDPDHWYGVKFETVIPWLTRELFP